MTTNQPREAALWFARHNREVFPVHGILSVDDAFVCDCSKGPRCTSPGKHPIAGLAPHGFKSASKAPATIEHWWTCVPRANIGLATGGVVVLDVDPRHGGDRSLADLEAKFGALPSTVRASTGGGGQHIYFRPKYQMTSGVIAPGL